MLFLPPFPTPSSLFLPPQMLMNARKTDVTPRLPATIPLAPSPADATLAIMGMDSSAHLVRFGEPDTEQKTLAPSIGFFYSL